MSVRMRRLICTFLDRNLNVGFLFRHGIVHIVKKLLLDTLGTHMFIFIYCLFIVHTVYILYNALPRGGNKIINQSESARYSIHLRKSITWSACGNGQKEKHEGKQDER